MTSSRRHYGNLAGSDVITAPNYCESFGLLPARQWLAWTGLTQRPSWSRRRQVQAASCSAGSLRPELVEFVLIIMVRPGLSDPAIAHVEHQHRWAANTAPISFGVRGVQPDDVLVVGHHIMEGCSEGPARTLGQGPEEAEHLASADELLVGVCHGPLLPLMRLATLVPVRGRGPETTSPDHKSNTPRIGDALAAGACRRSGRRLWRGPDLAVPWPDANRVAHESIRDQTKQGGDGLG
jgi:hypothetical protein